MRNKVRNSAWVDATTLPGFKNLLTTKRLTNNEKILNYENDVSIHSYNRCHGVKHYFSASVCSNRYPFYEDCFLYFLFAQVDYTAEFNPN